jgi:hypothetical protein
MTYKDIDEVMAAQSDLVEPLARFDPRLVKMAPSAVDNWRPEGWLAQLGWIRALGHEGGLFFTVGRRT